MIKILKKKFKSFKHLHCQFVIKVFEKNFTSVVVKDDEKIERRLDGILTIISPIILQSFIQNYDENIVTMSHPCFYKPSYC